VRVDSEIWVGYKILTFLEVGSIRDLSHNNIFFRDNIIVDIYVCKNKNFFR
jgi:hypothetical protein